ncbi:MAG: DUF393 domain-containing protein [Ramlibacter sp.]|jgi:predicted DCC family thiol-disulfide oxidoreductase YuxK|nr:DUF393 domain-containing protein [Ramlibacter sp.]
MSQAPSPVSDTVWPLTIYFESACPLCNAEMTNLQLRNTSGMLAFVDVSAADFESPLPGVSLAELMEVIHAQAADGRVIRGVDVFRLAYHAVGLGWVTRGLSLPGVGRLADRTYPWVARNRHRFPRWMASLVFETAVRRAAEQAARRAHCMSGSTCRTSSQTQ